MRHKLTFVRISELVIVSAALCICAQIAGESQILVCSLPLCISSGLLQIRVTAMLIYIAVTRSRGSQDDISC